MARSSYKLPYTSLFLTQRNVLFPPKVTQNNPSARISPGTSRKNVYDRSSTILPEMIGNTFQVHSGQRFVKVVVTEHMVGYKFGEFALSKKRALYKKKKKR